MEPFGAFRLLTKPHAMTQKSKSQVQLFYSAPKSWPESWPT